MLCMKRLTISVTFVTIKWEQEMDLKDMCNLNMKGSATHVISVTLYVFVTIIIK